MVRNLGFVQPTVGAWARAGRLTMQPVPHETKYVDHDRHSGTIASSLTYAGGEADPPTVNCLNGIVQGNAATERDGHVVVLTRLHIRGVVRIDPKFQDTAETPDWINIFVVLDTQTNGAQMNSEDLIINIDPTSVSQQANPQRNMLFGTRFKVLKHWRMVAMPSHSYSGQASPNLLAINGWARGFELYKKMRLPVRFNDANGTVSSIVDNSIHVIAVHQGFQTAYIDYSSRVRFVG